KRGALFMSDLEHARKAWVDVRVGDYSFDSSEDPELDWLQEGLYEPSDALPVEDSDAALRHTLWLQTDLRYKQALASYLKLKGQRVYKTDDDVDTKRPSFSAAPAIVHADPLVTLTFDRARWERVARAAADRLAAHQHLFDTEVQVDLQVETRWIVNSEG